MTIVLPADMTDTHEEERGTFNFRRASLMFESRTPTLVTYSFIPHSDDGLIQWLSDAAMLADPRLFVHWGFDGIELAITARPCDRNELHTFPLAVQYSGEEAFELANIAFPTKKPTTRIIGCTD